MKQKWNFGEVSVDERIFKRIRLLKSPKPNVSLSVTPKYEAYNIDKVFFFEIVNNDNGINLDIFFEPKLSDYTYVNYYTVECDHVDFQKIILKGKGVGPKIRFSENVLKFRVSYVGDDYSDEGANNREDSFVIINKSKIDAYYQWLIPKHGCEHFKLSIGNYGIIKGNERLKVTVNFIATTLGTYTEELVFLIQNQEPIILNLIGSFFDIHNPEDLSPRSDVEINTSWEHFMRNSLKVLDDIPMASIYPCHLDFKQGSETNILQNISQNLSVTNHQNVEGRFHWLPDQENIFIVDPVNATIPPNESCVFTVRFRPKVQNRAYGDILCGHFTYTRGSEVQYATVEQWFRIPCAGHTFQHLYNVVPDYKIDAKIVMPPTIPGLTTYRNVSLSNLSDDDLYFTFNAPATGHFIVLPYCGMVPGNKKQIISVAFQPKDQGIYYEDWELELNHNTVVRVSFEASAEEGSVEISSSGLHPTAFAMQAFEPTTTGCASYCYTVIHNTTRNVLELRFESTASWLVSEGGSSITLEPNEVVPQRWWFYPKKHNKVYETFVNMACVTIINGVPVGKFIEYVVFFTGYAENPKLTVDPKHINLQEITIDDERKFEMLLYNYGTCDLMLKLNYTIKSIGDDHSLDVIDIPSTVFHLKPYEAKCIVAGSVLCKSIGWRQIDVSFSILYQTETEETCFKHFYQKIICQIWYDGVYPTIQVKRVISENSPVIFSAHCLWSMLHIDSVNDALKKCKQGEKRTVNVYPPKMGDGCLDVAIILILDCVTNSTFAWQAKRLKLCSCQMVQVKIGTSLYEKRYDCKHRDMLRLEPMFGEIQPERAMELKITASYSEVGKHTMAYILSLPNDRSLKLVFHLETLDRSIGTLVSLRKRDDADILLGVLDCGRVPINNLDKVHRVMWLYNPTDTLVSWRLMRSSREHADVIDCLHYHAIIPAKSRFALPFSFLPTEMINYEDTFLCMVENKLMSLLVKGQGGLPDSVETRLDMPRFIQKRIATAHRSNQVYLSEDHITLPPTPINTTVNYKFYIYNDTEHRVKFTWLTEKVGLMTRITVSPRMGNLEPKTRHALNLTVYLLQDAASFTISVACEVTDMTMKINYENDQLWKKMKTELCQQEFIITEEGVSYPGLNDSPPYVLDLPPPKPFFLSLSLAICSVGQRDGYHRFCLRHLIYQEEKRELTDFANIEEVTYYSQFERRNLRNIISSDDVLRVIEGVLWDALSEKLMCHLIKTNNDQQIQKYNPLLLQTTKASIPIAGSSLIAQQVINEESLVQKTSEEILEGKMIVWSVFNGLISKVLHEIFKPKDDCLYDCYCYVPNYV